MNTGDFEFLRGFLKGKSGYTLEEGKTYLLESRLWPVLRRWNYPDFSTLVLAMRGFADPRLLSEVVDVMMDYDTCFFRDFSPFQHLKKSVLPQLIDNRKSNKRLRVWCAGVATGQEAYSLAILLKESGIYARNWKVEILATDISNSILDAARQAIYTQFAAQRGLPIAYLLRYFTQLSEQKWQVNQDLRKLVTFQRSNLLEDIDSIGTCDLIVCRNVMVDFDETTHVQILNRLGRMLSKDGYLVLGKDAATPDGFVPAVEGEGIFRLAPA